MSRISSYEIRPLFLHAEDQMREKYPQLFLGTFYLISPLFSIGKVVIVMNFEGKISKRRREL